MDDVFDIRPLTQDELSRIGEIDRTEHIEVLYEQHGTELVERRGDWSALAWTPTGAGGHSVEGQRRALEHYVERGGVAFGAFTAGRLVGIGLVVPHLRPGVAQLAFLHVTNGQRGKGLGTRLAAELEHVARDRGNAAMVVSATPSANTVRFYRSIGFELMAVPLPELFELEPDDVHMRKAL